VLIGRQPRKTVAAINEFFNCELQVRILCWNARHWTPRVADCPLPVGN
jgi:hypothetical protein